MLSLERQNEFRELYRQLSPGWQPATEVYAALVRGCLQAQSRLLDLGCGRGGLVEQFDRPLPQIIGVDPDLQSLREHRLTWLPRAVAVSDYLPFPDNSFDLIFCSWLLEHLEQPLCTLQQIARILRPGGSFVFITPNRRHPLIWLNQAFSRFTGLQRRMVERFYGRAAGDTFPTFYRANSLAALRLLARQSHLELAEVRLISDPTYLAFTPALFHLMCRLEARLAVDRRLHLVGVLKRLV